MPALYYSPDGDGVITKIDLGRGMTDVRPLPRRTSAVVADGVGMPHAFDFGGLGRVLLQAEKLTSASVFRELQTFETALRRRGLGACGVTFATTPSKLWVGAILTGSSGLSAGDTVLETTGNIFDYETVTISAGDVLVVESGNPEALAEYVAVDSVAPGGTDITITAPLKYTRTVELGVTVRHYRCWPALYLPADQEDKDIIFAENGRLYTLDMELAVNGRFIQSVAGGTIGADEYTLAAGLNL